MKRCPTCSRVFDDVTLRFCFDDGTELVNKLPDGGAPKTLHIDAPEDAPSRIQTPPLQTPYANPAVKRHRLWPWALGGAALVLVAIFGVTVGRVLMHLKKPLVHHLVVRLDHNPDRSDEVAATIAIIRNRLNVLGAGSFEVKPGAAGTGEIVINLPRLENPARLKQIITMTGKLEFAHVISPPSPQPIQTFASKESAQQSLIEHSDMPGYALAYRDDANSQNGKWVLLEQTPIIGEYDIQHATAAPSIGSPGNYEVQFSLRLLGAERLATWTNTHINEYMAVVVNNEVKSIVDIKSQISDEAVITGRFTKQSAEDLATVLNATGRLPESLSIVSETIDN